MIRNDRLHRSEVTRAQGKEIECKEDAVKDWRDSFLMRVIVYRSYFNVASL